MECIRDATQRCHVGRDSGREDDKSLMFIGCGWSAGVCVELIELRVVQIAALGWRPGSVGCHGDHTPVGGLFVDGIRQGIGRPPEHGDADARSIQT